MNPAQAVCFEIARTIRSDLDQAVRGAMGLGELAARFDLKCDKVLGAARKPMGELYRRACVRACRECGCWDEEACRGGCAWMGPNLCSTCWAKKRRKRR